MQNYEYKMVSLGNTKQIPVEKEIKIRKRRWISHALRKLRCSITRQSPTRNPKGSEDENSLETPGGETLKQKLREWATPGMNSRRWHKTVSSGELLPIAYASVSTWAYVSKYTLTVWLLNRHTQFCLPKTES